MVPQGFRLESVPWGCPKTCGQEESRARPQKDSQEEAGRGEKEARREEAGNAARREEVAGKGRCSPESKGTSHLGLFWRAKSDE
jgi:hypothetical protein